MLTLNEIVQLLSERGTKSIKCFLISEGEANGAVEVQDAQQGHRRGPGGHSASPHLHPGGGPAEVSKNDTTLLLL